MVKVNDNECFISNKALSIVNFSSKENSRINLTGLHIKNGLAECADGYMMGTYKVEQGKDFPECLIPVADLKIAGFSEDKGVKITKDGEQFIISGKYKVITRPITKDFPNTDKLMEMAVAEKNQYYVGFSTHVLQHLIEGLKKSGNDMVCLKIPAKTGQGTPNNQIIEFCSYNSIQNAEDKPTGEYLTGLLMPCVTKPNNYKWATDKVKKQTTK